MTQKPCYNGDALPVLMAAMLLLLTCRFSDAAGCSPSPDDMATSGTLWTDPDGPGSAYLTPPSDTCTWTIGCNRTGNRTNFVVTFDFEGPGFGVTVFDGNNNQLGGMTPNIFASSAAQLRYGSTMGPFKIVTAGSQNYAPNFLGAAVFFNCYREVDPQYVPLTLPSRATRTVVFSPDNYTEDPYNGTLPLIAHVQYNVSCPSGQSLWYQLLYDPPNLGGNFTLTKSTGYGPWTGVDWGGSGRYGPVWSDSATWTVFDMAGFAGVGNAAPMFFNCTPHQFLACSNRFPQSSELHHDRTATFAMEARERGILYRFASTARGVGDGESAWPTMECGLHVYCVDDNHEVAINYFTLFTEGRYNVYIVNPDRSVRMTILTGSAANFGTIWSSYAHVPMTDLTFPTSRASAAAVDYTADAVYPYTVPAAMAQHGGVYVNISVPYDNGRGYDPYIAVAGYDIYFECRLREATEIRTNVDLVADAAKDLYGLASAVNVTFQQWASAQPIGYTRRFRLSTYTDSDAAIHHSGVALPWGVGDVHPVSVPLTCGLYSNMFVTLEDIQGFSVYTYILRPAFIDRGNSTNLRFVGATRRSNTDKRPWGYSDSPYFSGATTFLIDSPAEIEWSTVRLDPSYDIPSVEITVECTLHGRNGPPATYDWVGRAGSTLFLSAVAQPSNFLKPQKETEGRTDAVSSDADGGLSGFTTQGNVVVNLTCPRRFTQCTIIIKQIYASLDPARQNFSITAADGSWVLNASDAKPIIAIGDWVDAGLYAFNGATITLTSTSPTVVSNGFTVSFTMDSSMSVQALVTPTSSRTKSYVLTDTRPLTVTPTVSASVSAGVSRSNSRTVTPPPTRTTTKTRSRRHPGTVSPTTSITQTPTIPLPTLAPVFVNSASQAATASTATTAAAVTALGGASAPPDSVVELQALAAIAGMLCDESDNVALRNVIAVAGPARTSMLPFSIDPNLPEGYIVGSLLLVLGAGSLHTVVMLVYRRQNKGSLRAAMTLSRYPSASLALGTLLFTGLLTEPLRLLIPLFSAPRSDLLNAWHTIFFCVLGVVFALAVPVVGIVVHVKMLPTFQVEFRKYDSSNLAAMVAAKKSKEAQRKALKAELTRLINERRAEDAPIYEHYRQTPSEREQRARLKEQQRQLSSSTPSFHQDVGEGGATLVVPMLHDESNPSTHSFESSGSIVPRLLPSSKRSEELRASIKSVKQQISRLKHTRELPNWFVALPGPIRPAGYWIPRHRRDTLGYFFGATKPQQGLAWFLMPFVRGILLCFCIFCSPIPCTVRLSLAAAMPLVSAALILVRRPYISPFRTCIAVPTQIISGLLLIVAAVPGITPETRAVVLQALMNFNTSLGLVSAVAGLVVSTLESKFRAAYDHVVPPQYKIDQMRRRAKAEERRKQQDDKVRMLMDGAPEAPPVNPLLQPKGRHWRDDEL